MKKKHNPGIENLQNNDGLQYQQIDKKPFISREDGAELRKQLKEAWRRSTQPTEADELLLEIWEWVNEQYPGSHGIKSKIGEYLISKQLIDK